MVVLLTAFPNATFASEKTSIVITNEAPEEVSTMLNRLEEIKTMNKSSLQSSEKKALRKEVRAIRSSLRSSGNGIYLSTGAIILIVVLLIVLL